MPSEEPAQSMRNYLAGWLLGRVLRDSHATTMKIERAEPLDPTQAGFEVEFESGEVLEVRVSVKDKP